MERIVAYFALLLFITFSGDVKAEDFDTYLAKEQQKQRKAERVIGILHAAGLTHPMVEKTAAYVEENISDDYFYFTQKKHKNLNLGLRHELGSPKLERLEMYMQPDDSDYVYTLSPEAVMVRYRVEF